MQDAGPFPRSPLLLPSDRHRQLHSHVSVDSLALEVREGHDVLDDLDFLDAGAPWREDPDDAEHGDAEDEDEAADELEDFSLEDGHIQGVPSAGVRLEAKQYQTSEFATELLELLRNHLQIAGWATLPADTPSSLILIHKVSGSLTNAVFFVSIPACEFQVVAPPVSPATPLQRLTVLSLAGELDGGRATPTPDGLSRAGEPETMTVHIEAPTMLLRIYGPSSGSLISRKTELHILHTLSTDYAIGPRVLGTFSNGRVEQYFHSRALTKEEMRDGRISRWIGRRMRELHRVELETMVVPDQGGAMGSRDPSRGRAGSLERTTGIEIHGSGIRNNSTGSFYSTSSGSSIFSFGTSIYSTSSAGSTTSLSTMVDGADFGTTPIIASPLLLPRRDSTESHAARKKRGRFGSAHHRHHDKLGVWENITRWTREAKLVLKALDELATLPGFSKSLGSATPAASSPPGHVLPLTAAALTFSLRAKMNLPLFEQQVKLYRNYVRGWEKANGKSKRVFSHNDTQYGNLLLMTPSDGDVEVEHSHPHEKIIVVDFEYASANPRGFDIANHFVEWQADYHHDSLSHALDAHAPYPTPAQRAQFLRAYVGCDHGEDDAAPLLSPLAAEDEDMRVLRLEQEVTVWEPSSHAMWAVWGIVQAKEDLLKRVEVWKRDCLAGRVPVVDAPAEPIEVDFDYLSYSLGRITLFRRELKALGIIE